MEKEKIKRRVHIDRKTGNNEIFTIFEKIESEGENDVQNLLEDSDIEFIAEEEIQDTNEDTHQLLTPEAVVHVEARAMKVNRHQRKR